MTVLEALLDDPGRALRLLNLELPELPHQGAEPISVNMFGNGPWSNWNNWENWTNG